MAICARGRPSGGDRALNYGAKGENTVHQRWEMPRAVEDKIVLWKRAGVMQLIVVEFGGALCRSVGLHAAEYD